MTLAEALPAGTLGAALANAEAYWDSCGLDNKMMPIRARAGVSILGPHTKLSNLKPSSGGVLLKGLQARGLSKSSVGVYYAAIRRMLALSGYDCSGWPKAPKAPRIKRTLPGHLTRETVTSLQASLRRRGFGETADLIELLYAIGLRSGVEALRWDAWKELGEDRAGGGSYLHVQGKGGHERVIPVRPDVATLMRDVEVSIKKVPYNTHYKRLKAVTKGTALEGLGFHDFRRRFASDAYRRSGHDLMATAELLGHADIKTTALYVSVDRDQLRRAAYD